MPSLILLAVLQFGAIPPEPSVQTQNADLLDTWTLVSVEWLGERTDQVWQHVDPGERTRWGDRVWRDTRVQVTFEKKRIQWVGGLTKTPGPRIIDYELQWKQGRGTLITDQGRHQSLISVQADTLRWCYDERDRLPKKVGSDIKDENIYLLVFRRGK
jgi:hypothetical protein